MQYRALCGASQFVRVFVSRRNRSGDRQQPVAALHFIRLIFSIIIKILLRLLKIMLDTRLVVEYNGDITQIIIEIMHIPLTNDS